jgi:hypothetical protein
MKTIKIAFEVKVSNKTAALMEEADYQYMVERLAAFARRRDEDRQLLAHAFLAYVFVEQLGAQGALERLFLARFRRRRYNAIGRGGKMIRFDGHGVAVSSQALESERSA